MGLLGVEEAITFAGEFTVTPSPGLLMVSGKPDDGGGGGSCAGGAGRELVVGDHVGGVGVGVGCGAGVGDGSGEGGAGVGPGLGCRGGSAPMMVVVLPHPARVRLASRRHTKENNRYGKERKEKCTTMDSDYLRGNRKVDELNISCTQANSLEVVELWISVRSSKESGLLKL